ncbi:MAG: putative cupredoxin-like copper-binding protein [Planctomycetota bacterium]|jgi:uncharacterized cupredoxin-like copper-binding protein
MKNASKFIFLAFFSASVSAGGTHDSGHAQMKFSVGEPGTEKADRSIAVSMSDSMRFNFAPDLGELIHGETIEFKVRNDGNVQHEFSIGNAEDQRKHAKMMAMMPDMDHKDPNTVSLLPGDSATLSWKFMGKDTVVFSCNLPGHFEAGMNHSLAIKKAKGEKVAAL